MSSMCIGESDEKKYTGSTDVELVNNVIICVTMYNSIVYRANK